MKLYIAARFAKRIELRPLVENLRAINIHSTSRWIVDDFHVSGTQEHGAQVDVEDVMASDAVLFFAEPNGSLNRGGGRYFELGMAWHAKKRIVAIQPPPMPEGHGVPGKHECVFLALPEIKVVKDLGEAIRALAQIRDELYY